MRPIATPKALARLEREDGILIVIIDDRPINGGSWGGRKGLLKAMEIPVSDDAIGAVIVIAAGKTFISGSDVRAFGKPLQESLVPQVIDAAGEYGRKSRLPT